MDTHSSLSWHTHYCFLVSLPFPTFLFFLSWMSSYLEKHNKKERLLAAALGRTTRGEECMFSVHLPELQNEPEVLLLLYGGLNVWLRSVSGPAPLLPSYVAPKGKQTGRYADQSIRFLSLHSSLCNLPVWGWHCSCCLHATMDVTQHMSGSEWGTLEKHLFRELWVNVTHSLPPQKSCPCSSWEMQAVQHCE